LLLRLLKKKIKIKRRRIKERGWSSFALVFLSSCPLLKKRKQFYFILKLF